MAPPAGRTEKSATRRNAPVRRPASRSSALIIAAVAGAALIAAGVGFIVLRAGAEPPPPPPQAAAPAPVEAAPEIAVPATAPAVDLAAPFAAAMTEAAASFDGDPAGYHTGRALLEERVINAPAFAGTPWVDQARARIADEETRLTAGLPAALEALTAAVYADTEALKHTEALARVEAFRAAWAGIGGADAPIEELAGQARTIILGQAAEWVRKAEGRAAAGAKEAALAELRELADALKGQTLPEVIAALDDAARRLDAGVAPGTPAAELTAQSLYDRAEAWFVIGNIPAAEEAFHQLLKLFPDDPVVTGERSWIDKRLRGIADMKAESVPGDIRVLFFDDCERVLTTAGTGRVSWNKGELQGERAYNGSRVALRSQPVRGSDVKVATEILGAVSRTKTLFQFMGSPIVTFWYYLEVDPKVTLKGDSLMVRAKDQTQTEHYYYIASRPEHNTWAFCAVPMARWKGAGMLNGMPKAGDRFTEIGFGAGAPGESVTLYVDNVAVVTGGTLYYIRDTLKQKAAVIRAVTSDYRQTFYTMDIQIIENLGARVGRTAASTVLVAGGLHANPVFTGLVKGLTGKQVTAIPGAGTAKATMAEIRSYLEKNLPRNPPGVVLIIAGIGDVVAGADPAIAAVSFQGMVDAAFKNGVVPVLCTVPASLDDKYKDGIAALNACIMQVAEDNDVPLIDIYRTFSFNADAATKFYTDKTLLNRQGYQVAAEKFALIMKAVDTYVFKVRKAGK
ncbi:MAG: GDSL-type esterase/lipase family protein [Planctomycetota bacterium]